MRRRTLLRVMAGASASALMPAAWWRTAVFAGAPASPGPSPYGALLAPDANGIELPAGFTSRVIAVTGQTVAGTSHVWHSAPDGGGCVADGSGGWVYASNAEIPNGLGGASAIRFAADGSITDAYTILSGTSWNCAGGMTPWSTWLSCEERGSGGHVHECDPFQPGQGIERPVMGSFNHEAAAVDIATGDVYLTEDHPTGRLYRFVPTVPGDLSAGALFAAAVDGAGLVTWLPTSPDEPDRNPATAEFAGGEGVYIADGAVYFTTKIDKRVWELDLAASTVSVAYDCLAHPEGSLDAVDNVTVHASTGRVFVAEDGGNMELGVMSGIGADRTVAAFCRIQNQNGSEVAGMAFSPDGSRLYLSSQRGVSATVGVTYEITGPFDTFVTGNQPVAVPIANGVYVRGGSNADSNFASRWSLEACYNGNDQYTRRTLLATSITSVAGPYERATLRVNARMWQGGPSPMDVFATESGWDPATVTWNTQPALIGTPLARFDIASSSPEWYEIDVTDHLNALHASGASVASFSIRQVQRNGPVAYIVPPKASSNRPELVLTSGAAPQPTDTVTIDIVNDSYTRGGSFANATFASGRLLHVKNNGNVEYTRWGHMAADLPAISRPVQSAVLRVNARMSTEGPSPMSLTATAPGWVDTSLTWANQPTPIGSAIATFVVLDTNSRWYDIDVTAHVEQLRLAGAATLSVVIRQEERGRLVYFNPSNHWTNDRPQLIVTF